MVVHVNQIPPHDGHPKVPLVTQITGKVLKEETMTKEPKIYTAEEVQSNGLTDEIITAELAQITHKAYVAASRGDTSVTYYPSRIDLFPVLLERLPGLGFQVRQNVTFFKDPEFLLITWAKTSKERK